MIFVFESVLECKSLCSSTPFWDSEGFDMNDGKHIHKLTTKQKCSNIQGTEESKGKRRFHRKLNAKVLKDGKDDPTTMKTQTFLVSPTTLHFAKPRKTHHHPPRNSLNFLLNFVSSSNSRYFDVMGTRSFPMCGIWIQNRQHVLGATNSSISLQL